MFRILLQPQCPQPAHLANFISQSLFPSERPDLSDSIAPLPALGSLGSPLPITPFLQTFLGSWGDPSGLVRHTAPPVFTVYLPRACTRLDSGTLGASFLVMICEQTGCYEKHLLLTSCGVRRWRINCGTALCCWSSTLITRTEIVCVCT